MDLKHAMEMESEDNEVEIDKEEMIKEHKRLIKILRDGSASERRREAERQEEELKVYMKNNA